ncbi:hypothetical protein Pint_35444 [Pistacia integerrima]|uniref:Uncharacterized protein n=1 Tax=Pistacia integerrima TaxID=434235 RepID=A0ACC0Y3B2_9ROSI|nr:hypothetical protein Pint_35444 [Pistacia integerrima]
MDIGFLCGEEKSDSSSNLVKSLDSNLGGSLQTQDSCEHNTSDGDGIGDVGKGLEELKLDEAKSSPKILHKCPGFPSPVKISNSATSDEQDEDEELMIALQQMFSEDSTHVPSSRSLSLPTPFKLVSAMKGSREREGGSPRKLTVKWAPDVYDPPPTIVSHTVNRGRKQQKFKKDERKKQKNGKKGQRGNSSHGSGKDKRQFRKSAGSTDKGFKSIDIRDRVMELSDDLKDFDVGGRESYCGSIFLKQSLSKVHYSVAEAL